MPSEYQTHGKALALRMAPFIAVSAACVVYGLLAGIWLSVVAGVLALGGFAFSLWRNWTPS